MSVAALIVSIVALLVSGVSAFFIGRTYWRAGARVRVAVDKQLGYQITYVNGPILDDVLSVTVTNRGLASVQVANVFFEIRGQKGFVEATPSGPQLPCVLDGNSREVWIPSISTFLKVAGIEEDGHAKIRAGVVLGNDTQCRSPWITLTAADRTPRSEVSRRYREG